MTATQLPLSLAQPHRNQQLFSDHYLNTVLPTRPDWKALADEAGAVQQQVRAILDQFVPSHIEAQTEDGLVKPVLTLLGHTYEVQAALKTPKGTKKPDYVFYTDSAARALNKNQTLDDQLLAGRAFAVGDAKHWDRPLDVSLKLKGADPDINKVPSDQIAFYMLHSGATWGILTNGRLWRLYHTDTAQKQDRFYEVDLEALVRQGTPQDFCYFYAFFRRHAFDDHDLSAAAILQASVRSARAISEDLRQQVYHALLALAQGFLDYPGNGLSPDPQTLRQIYDSSLILLYRILFVLYAEARELLPLRSSALYRTDYSLSALAGEVAARVDSGRTLLPSGSRLWARLRDLFGYIDAGNPDLGVATFNGGLFDPRRHEFLARYTVGDARLAEAIDRLTRVDREFIDYRDLAERHLGTIYEGLLEQHLAPMAPREGWTVELLDSAGERHRTGSYYTPDFVVQYIVAQTVGPALERATAGRETDEAKLQAVLEVNVCDPAMGSGHFLVAAMEYIARYLVELGISPGEAAGGEADLAFWKRRVAQSCIYGVDLNPLAVELAKLSLWLVTAAKDRPLSFLDHHLRCGNAVVGTRLDALDLQPQATKPARARKARKEAEELVAAGQASMLDNDEFRRSMSGAVDSLWLIEENPALTIADVKQQEQLYTLLRSALTQRYTRLGDLAAARRLGLQMPDELWGPLTDFVTGRSMAAVGKVVELAEQARGLVEQHRPFHWEMEFPEVFFDKHGQPLGDLAGFDAVVGNPPYVRQELLAPIKPYLQAAYPEVYHGVADLYVYFYQRGVELLQRGGRMSYIVTNKWMRAGYGEPLRGFFAERTRVEQLIDFGHAPIFAEADVFPCILVLERPGDEASEGRQVAVTEFPREALGTTTLERYTAAHSRQVPSARLGRAAWSLEASNVDDLLAKIRGSGLPLTEFAGGKPYRGVLTGFNEAFLIDTPTKNRLVQEDPRSAEIIKPYLRGQDVKRWSLEWDQLWMIFARRGIVIDDYPAIKQHLLPHRERLEPQPRDWAGGAWPGRKQGPYQWYEVQDSVEYWPLFERPKLVYQEIQFHPSYGWDNRGLFANNKVFMLPTTDLWLVAVLNAPLMWWHNWRYLPHMKDEALNPVGALMEKLPIAPPTDEQRSEAEPAVARLIALTREGQQARRDTLDWLRVEFGVETPGQKLEAFDALDEVAFLEEVRKRRPRSAGALTPKGLAALRAGYTEQAAPARERTAEALRLERRLAALVNDAYGLTPEEVDLLWRTAPPRMPVGRE